VRKFLAGGVPRRGISWTRINTEENPDLDRCYLWLSIAGLLPQLKIFSKADSLPQVEIFSKSRAG